MLGDWLILTATLPTTPSALRVRVWRALKATGAGALREGVHILPAQAGTAQALRELAPAITAAGASAHLLQVQARDEAQEQAFRALFDRSDVFADLAGAVQDLHSRLRLAPEAGVHKELRALASRLQALQAHDFFPGAQSERTAQAWAALQREVQRRRAPGEPTAATATAIPRRAIGDYRRRTWATRRRPWVDRLATAWLVQRFIDPEACFIWLDDPRACPATALGYDFDGATFTHVGEKVSVEVVAESFGLLGDPALVQLASLVRCIDLGGPALDEAAGLEMIVRGLQACHADDDRLLAAALPVFDALHAACRTADPRA